MPIRQKRKFSMKKLLSPVLSVLSATVGILITASMSPVHALGAIRVPEKGFAEDLGTYIASLLSLVLVIAALMVFFQLIYGGIQWIVSGGDKAKTEAARGRITSAVIGIIILAASYAILLLVLNFLGFENLQDLLESIRRL